MSIFLAHGSVETSTDQEYIDGLIAALTAGYNEFTKSQCRLNAVEKLVNSLEDNPLFNAGYGSVLNKEGFVEVDGSIMDGATGKFGAVAAMPGIKHAISVAKHVLEDTEHLVLAGQGAADFAIEKGFTFENCITDTQLKMWQKAKEFEAKKLDLVFSPFTGLIKKTDTVGCVMIDDQGKLAAGSSTGGSFYKLPGRVGDTPFIGGGIFASETCAIVCTGRGEAFIQTLTAKYVDEQLKKGLPLREVAISAIKRLKNITNERGGLIAIDNQGNYVAAHNCDSFPVSVISNGKAEKVEPIYVDCG